MSGGAAFISNSPQLAIARETALFSSLGLNDTSLVRIIYKFNDPWLSYKPTEEYNAIAGIEEGESYLLYLNGYFDGSPALANAVLDNLIPQTTTNVFADKKTAFICTTAVDFATAGITTLNTRLITLADNGVFISYDPNEAENGISGFELGKIYWIDPILDMDLSPWGVTKVRYSDEVMYMNDLEDVVITNPEPGATLPLDTEEILVRNPITGIWENVPYEPGIPSTDIPDGVISGCKVIWESGLTFRVTAGVYYIDGVRYELSEGTITLDAADPTNPRFDIIAVNDASAIVKLTGTPASDPSEPQVDPATQLYLTSVLVGAAATEPTGVSTVIIYDENAEWAPSTSGTISVNFANTLNVSNGTKAAAVASWSTGAAIAFANSTTLNVADVDTISLKVRLTTTLSKNQNLSLQFYNGGTPSSLQLPITLNKSLTGVYQAFSLSGIDFTNPLFDRVKILFTGSTSALYIDEVKYQKGVAQVGTETDPTVPALVKQIPVSADASTNKYLNWNGSSYVRKQIAYSEISGTPSIPSAYTDEQAQDAVGTILTDSDTIDFTYNDGTPSIVADVKKQMSIASDASGLKLSGDSSTPGNSKYYGTDGSGAKGFYSLPSGGSSTLVKPGNADYSASAVDQAIIFETTLTANRTLTIPTASGNTGIKISVGNFQTALFTVALSSTSSILYNGAAVSALSKGDWVTLMSDGTSWYVVQSVGKIGSGVFILKGYGSQSTLANSATTDTIFPYTLPANSLTKKGDRLRIYFFWLCTGGGSDNITVRIKSGSTTIIARASTGFGQVNYNTMTMDMVYDGVTTTLQFNNYYASGSLVSANVGSSTSLINWAAANDFTIGFTTGATTTVTPIFCQYEIYKE